MAEGCKVPVVVRGPVRRACGRLVHADGKCVFHYVLDRRAKERDRHQQSA